ncbi:HEAT repeat domain-containing protein [Nocardia sp. BMG51109]|uniref:HEAT repeat domain-containing protein n=1 Tax=Nocardia sp. BMG51109 TaxID=1056816 RepID=UPI0009FCEFA2|nr:HEAT repeat domain-containing protein [Nocardia sp. BMG51109]
MTPEDKRIILELVHAPGKPPSATQEDILQHFGTRDGKTLGLKLLRNATERRDAADIEYAMIVSSVFGFDLDHLDLLRQLSTSDWHYKHEDVVSALGELKTPAAVDALYNATQWIPEYLEFDDSRALATKAIWALGGTPGPEAEQALNRLLESDDEILRESSEKQLERRRNKK